MKSILGVAATGVVALLLWKVLLVVLLPFIGVAVGFAFLVVKFVFIGLMIGVAIWVARRWSRSEENVA